MKRAIFVRSKTIVMTELDKKIREKEIYRVTLVGSFVNFLLVIFKFLAGIAGHSAAMLADAVHSLSDFITDVVVILFVRISNKPVDKSHDYGHGKYETLATAFIGMASFPHSDCILIKYFLQQNRNNGSNQCQHSRLTKFPTS